MCEIAKHSRDVPCAPSDLKAETRKVPHDRKRISLVCGKTNATKHVTECMQSVKVDLKEDDVQDYSSFSERFMSLPELLLR